mgnify:CR=1 FL=1
MQERLKNALTAIGFCMLALVMTSVFATTVKAETNAELKNRVYEEVLNNHITNESDVIKVAIENCVSHSRYFSDELDAQFF